MQLEQDITTMLLGMPIMTTAYWVCLIVGGGLLLISTVMGGDADTGLDMDADLDIDIDTDSGLAGATALTSWFSMQFLVFFMAAFGLIGVAMTELSSQSRRVTLIGALVGGIVIGQGIHQVMRSLKKHSGDSTPHAQDYVDKPARVTVAVNQGKTGEVTVRVGRADRYVAARAKHDDGTFAAGDQVAIVDYSNGVARVVSMKEYEFLNDHDQAV